MSETSENKMVPLVGTINLAERVSKQLKFGLDYDGTITADPDMWATLIHMIRSRGHKVYIVTMRYPYEPIEPMFSSIVDYVIYTNRQAKILFIDRMNNPNFNIDIWIDDSPNWLFQNG